MKLTDVNLLDLDTFVKGVPHDQLKFLRENAPVYLHPEPAFGPFPAGRGFWCVTKYEDVAAISKDNVLFSSEKGGVMIMGDVDPASGSADGGMGGGMNGQMMLTMDPPRHARYRQLVNKGFTPRMTAALEPRVRDRANDIIDRVASRGECDFVTDIAAELPLQVIAELLGVPHEDRGKVFEWSNRMIGAQDPEFSGQNQERVMNASIEMYAYANQLAEDRRKNPTGDLISILLEGEVDGERLSEMEFDLFFLLLAVAGNETTRNLISGGMLALMEHPDQRDRMLNDPSLLPTGIEEMLRWVSPVMHFRRTATRDTEIRGQQIKAFDKLVIWYISANRDEDVFTDPYTFDVGRTPNDHLTFGLGEHFCLGANLARLEIRVVFEELFRRLPDVKPAGPVERMRSNFINSIKHLPVEFTKAPVKAGV
jgi:cytochrome P450